MNRERAQTILGVTHTVTPQQLKKIYYKKELDQIQNTSGSNYFANSNTSNDPNKELNIIVKNHRRSILKNK